MNRLMDAGRQLGLNVVTRDPVQKLLLISHRLVNRVSMCGETLQLGDRPAVTLAATVTPRRGDRLQIAERDHKRQGCWDAPTHHINLRHDLHHSVNHVARPAGALTVARECRGNLITTLRKEGFNAARLAGTRN